MGGRGYRPHRARAGRGGNIVTAPSLRGKGIAGKAGGKQRHIRSWKRREQGARAVCHGERTWPEPRVTNIRRLKHKPATHLTVCPPSTPVPPRVRAAPPLRRPGATPPQIRADLPHSPWPHHSPPKSLPAAGPAYTCGYAFRCARHSGRCSARVRSGRPRSARSPGSSTSSTLVTRVMSMYRGAA